MFLLLKPLIDVDVDITNLKNVCKEIYDCALNEKPWIADHDHLGIPDVELLKGDQGK